MENALKRTMGDRRFLKELVGAFMDQLPGHLSEIKLALDQENTTTLMESAHKLKGAATSVGMAPLSGIAQAVETSARNRNFRATAELVQHLYEEFDRLKAYTKEINWQ